MLSPFGVKRAPAATQSVVEMSITEEPLIFSMVTGLNRPARIASLRVLTTKSICWAGAPSSADVASVSYTHLTLPTILLV